MIFRAISHFELLYEDFQYLNQKRANQGSATNGNDNEKSFASREEKLKRIIGKTKKPAFNQID
ncbi:hypothetical protein BK412_12960 [Vibrio campbellii]|nr:hypothetical protein BK412_12960 [Vibrio campbellii]